MNRAVLKYYAHMKFLITVL